MTGRWPTLVAVCLAAVVAGGCGGAGPRSAWWSGAPSADLVPSGLTLVGGFGESGIVVDGSGMAWVDGPAQVARIDPGSGEATVWDAGDDVVFGTSWIAPASGPGVWLVTGDRVRLFDGTRFVVDLAVPEAARGGSTGVVAQVVDRDGSVWVSSTGGVARWRDGAWAAMAEAAPAGEGEPTSGIPSIAVDSEGALWAGGVTTDAGTGLQRFDGTSWRITDAGDPPDGRVNDLAADPRGGIWALAWSAEDYARQEPPGVYRFDGSLWRQVNSAGYAGGLSVSGTGQVWAAVVPCGGGSGAGTCEGDTTVLARLQPDGAWRTFGDAPGGPVLGWVSLALVGEQVLLTNSQQLPGSGGASVLRFDGRAYTPAWVDPTAQAVTPLGGLLAESADVVWVQADRGPSPAGGASIAGLSAYRAGAWLPVGPATGPYSWPVPEIPAAPALATDGAVWVATRPDPPVVSLVRIAGEQATVVTRAAIQGRVSAGADGSVWVALDGEPVRVDPDGTRTAIGRPPGSPPVSDLVAGPDGSVWAGSWWHGKQQLTALWDGEWTLVDLPDTGQSVSEALIAVDGSLWAILTTNDGSASVQRYSAGRWTRLQEGPPDLAARGLALAPDGSVCTMLPNDSVVACFDPTGEVHRVPLGVPAAEFSVGTDGAVWVLGEQVARLPDRVG